MDEATTQKTSVGVRFLTGLSALPLLVVALFILVIGGVMTETGASDWVRGLQGVLVLLATVGFLGAATLGIGHAFTGTRGTLTAFAVLLGTSVALGLAVWFGFSTWCTDCGSA
jgi:hypothetical protein